VPILGNDQVVNAGVSGRYEPLPRIGRGVSGSGILCKACQHNRNAEQGKKGDADIGSICM
jgi:hypothetical protein